MANLCVHFAMIQKPLNYKSNEIIKIGAHRDGLIKFQVSVSPQPAQVEHHND